jgi:short-subunit dehydrogenase
LNIAAEKMQLKKAGIIIGISSVAGERGRASNYLYGSAKAGFTAYLSGLRNRLYPLGIRVITLKPGFVYSKMTEHLTLPPRLTASPEQVAKVVIKNLSSGSEIIYVKPIWAIIMTIIRLIPEFFFKKLKL